MLTLDRLEISGFKSFGDRVDVRFPPGITAVVGPNGCGKSNIGDALNWVLGEQSAKMLRGRQMADVIFNGTVARKPRPTAEVSLHLGGAEGLPYAESGKAVVTRRLFRSGESEYLLNGSRARLKDIQSLLRDARIGARSYATIEQGRIDQVLNAKPKERRLMIEDAAGVAGYKHKRRLTELKLEATQANLLRVSDIVTEVRRQINSMKRQASKARRYQALRDELRDREQLRFALRILESDRELARLVAKENTARDVEVEAAADTGRQEVAVIEERQALESANEQLREIAGELHQVEIEIDRQEGQVRNCVLRIEESDESGARQRSEAERLEGRRAEAEEQLAAHRRSAESSGADLERLEETLDLEQSAWNELEGIRVGRRDAIEDLRRRQFDSMHRSAELRNRLRREEESLERNRHQQARLTEEQAGLARDRSQLADRSASLGEDQEFVARKIAEEQAARAATETQLSAAREEQADLVRELAESRELQKSAGAELRTLEDVATRFAGFSDGVRTLLTSDGPSEVRTQGVVADFIQATSEVERAAEGYLSWFLPTVILEDDADVGRAVALLRSTGSGRTTFISRGQPVGCPAVGQPSNGSSTIPADLLSDSRVRGLLRDRMQLNTSLNGTIQDRFGDAVLVDDLPTALELHRRHPRADYLTADGDVVYASGVISVSGNPADDKGLLAHNRRTQEARARHAEARTTTAALDERTKSSRERLLALELQLRGRQESLEQLSRRGLELELATRAFEDERQKTGRRHGILDDELRGTLEESIVLAASIAAITAEVQTAESSHRALEQELQGLSGELEETERRLKEQGEVVAGMRAELAALRQRHDTLDQEGARRQEALSELAERIGRLTAEAEAARERGAEAASLKARTDLQLAVHLGARKKLADRIGEAERGIVEGTQRLAERETALRQARLGLESHRESTREIEVERARVEAAREHLDDLCRRELDLAARETLDLVGDRIEGADAEALEREVGEIRESITRIGPVNLAAIEEFTELEERNDFLTAQSGDLEQSMTSLKEAIRRINRQSRERFSEAFLAISGFYQEIFKLLFNGGRASLELEEGEDILECGIEIKAQPPGKRLSNLALLSGGEKSLSAIALLFAVFRYQPSPFCLLDEVDAALDEANVGRFSRMIREYSKQTQFILITHNKMTMESADLLYGVTMEEPGVSRVISLQLD